MWSPFSGSAAEPLESSVKTLPRPVCLELFRVPQLTPSELVILSITDEYDPTYSTLLLLLCID